MLAGSGRPGGVEDGEGDRDGHAEQSGRGVDLPGAEHGGDRSARQQRNTLGPPTAALAAADTRPRSASGVRVTSRVEAHTFAYPFPVPPRTDSGTSIQTAGTTANGARAAQVRPAPAIVAQVWTRSVLSRPAPSDPATIPAIHAA